MRHQSTANCRASATMICLRRAPLLLVLTQPPPPLAPQPVIGLKVEQPPRAFDENGPDPPVAVFVDVALEAPRTRTVLARTQTGVAADLAAVFEPGPVGHFAL